MPKLKQEYSGRRDPRHSSHDLYATHFDHCDSSHQEELDHGRYTRHRGTGPIDQGAD